LPPLKIMRARLEGLGRVDPRHGRRGKLEVAMDDDWLELDDALEPVATGFERMLRAHDPDLIVSEWGDSTLFPSLLQQARRERITLSLNRDRRPPHLRVQPGKARRHFLQHRVHHLPDGPQGMIRRHPLLWRNVTEHRFLFLIGSAHPASFAPTFRATDARKQFQDANQEHFSTNS
jgi:hypothetical protein